MARKLFPSDMSSTRVGSNIPEAAVSPWFSTHFNTKNWVFICEEQPVRRWQQILDMKPALVEIITWNG